MNFLFVHLIVCTMRLGWRNDAVATVRKNTKIRRFTFIQHHIECYNIFSLPFFPTNDIFVPPTHFRRRCFAPRRWPNAYGGAGICRTMFEELKCSTYHKVKPIIIIIRQIFIFLVVDTFSGCVCVCRVDMWITIHNMTAGTSSISIDIRFGRGSDRKWS